MNLSKFFHFNQGDSESLIYNIEKINYFRINLDLKNENKYDFVIFFSDDKYEYLHFGNLTSNHILDLIELLLNRYSFLNKHEIKIFDDVKINLVNTNNLKAFSIFPSYNNSERVRYIFDSSDRGENVLALAMPDVFTEQHRKNILRRTMLMNDGSNQIVTNISDVYG